MFFSITKIAYFSGMQKAQPQDARAEENTKDKPIRCPSGKQLAVEGGALGVGRTHWGEWSIIWEGAFFPAEALRGGFKDKLALELGFENWWHLNI